MTLNITIVNQWGVWQCSDLRLTEWPSGKVVDDYSIKHVTVRATDGAALVTYTGLGKVRGNYVSSWLRRTIRGESRTVEETLNLIRDRATSQLGNAAAGLGIHHTFSVGAFIRGWPGAFLITNMDPADPLNRPPLKKFTGTARMIHTHGPQLMLAGTKGAVTHEDIALLNRIVGRNPKRPLDYRRLMAGVNRRASQQYPLGNLISEACVTSYIPPAGEPFQNETHWWGMTRPKVERVVPMTLFGIDLTEVAQVQLDHLEDITSPDEAHRALAQERYERLMRKAERRMLDPNA